MNSDPDGRSAMGLLILRFFLGIFLLQWSMEKLILPSATESIARGFYDVTLPAETPMALGIAELLLSLGLLFGGFRTISYGLSLLVHTVTVAVSWRRLMDPYGLAKIGNHLWIATWPTWGAFAALFLMRSHDIYTIDGWRQRRHSSSSAHGKAAA